MRRCHCDIVIVVIIIIIIIIIIVNTVAATVVSSQTLKSSTFRCRLRRPRNCSYHFNVAIAADVVVVFAITVDSEHSCSVNVVHMSLSLSSLQSRYRHYYNHYHNHHSQQRWRHRRYYHDVIAVIVIAVNNLTL